MERKIQRIEKVSPPAGGELLCPWRQSNQNATGDAADGHFVPIGPLSPDPITVDAYLLGFAIFPARKNGVVSAISSGPLGPGFAKIAATAISQLRLSLPNQRSRSVFPRRGDPCGRPEHGSAGVRPLRKKTPCGYPVGAAHRAARRSPPHNVIPAAVKTLSIRGRHTSGHLPAESHRSSRLWRKAIVTSEVPMSHSSPSAQQYSMGGGESTKASGVS